MDLKQLLPPIYPLPHHPRAPECNYSSSVKRQLLSGCRIPTLPWSFSLRREFTESAVENVLTGFQCLLYQFENRFNHFSRFVLWEAGLIIDRLNQIILYRP
jgi:hypothetical protein